MILFGNCSELDENKSHDTISKQTKIKEHTALITGLKGVRYWIRNPEARDLRNFEFSDKVSYWRKILAIPITDKYIG